MALSYVEQRLQQALKLSGGNLAKARKQVAVWCLEDADLLQALTRPHMTGIIAHAVDRVANKKYKPHAEEIPDEEVEDSGLFGKELLKNFAMGAPTKFAQESFGAPLKKRKASKKHIDAIYRLAKKKK